MSDPTNIRCKHGVWMDVACEYCGRSPENTELLPEASSFYSLFESLSELITDFKTRRNEVSNPDSKRLYSLAITDLESAENWLMRVYNE